MWKSTSFEEGPHDPPNHGITVDIREPVERARSRQASRSHGARDTLHPPPSGEDEWLRKVVAITFASELAELLLRGRAVRTMGVRF